MELRYGDETFEDRLYKEFWDDTKEYWKDGKKPDLRDFIKWAIITGKFKPSSFKNIDANDLAGRIKKLLASVLNESKYGEPSTFSPEDVAKIIKDRPDSWWKA